MLFIDTNIYGLRAPIIIGPFVIKTSELDVHFGKRYSIRVNNVDVSNIISAIGHMDIDCNVQ